MKELGIASVPDLQRCLSSLSLEAQSPPWKSHCSSDSLLGFSSSKLSRLWPVIFIFKLIDRIFYLFLVSCHEFFFSFFFSDDESFLFTKKSETRTSTSAKFRYCIKCQAVSFVFFFFFSFVTFFFSFFSVSKFFYYRKERKMITGIKTRRE